MNREHSQNSLTRQSNARARADRVMSGDRPAGVVRPDSAASPSPDDNDFASRTPEAALPDGGEPMPPTPDAESFVFTPPIDIYDTPEGLVLCADLPGVSIESLELQVQDNKLSLFGRVTWQVPDGGRLLHDEYRIGDFLRSFILSGEIDHERISATMNQGVLKVVLPRLSRAEPRRIQVKSD